MIYFVNATDEVKGLADQQKLRWLLEQSIEALGRRDGAANEGWLARLRLQSGVPLEDEATALQRRIEVNISAAGDFDQEDPYAVLGRIMEVKEKGQMALAAALFDMLTSLFSCPSLGTEYEVIEAMEAAGFGRLVMIDTGLGMPR
jgi:hypothetical protein